MAFGIAHHFKGGTKGQYDATVEAVHPAGGLPEGQTHHFAGPTDDGFVVVATFEDKGSYETFRDETLMPGLQDLGDSGLPGPPEEIAFEIDVEQHA
jgi:hypothetical protein